MYFRKVFILALNTVHLVLCLFVHVSSSAVFCHESRAKLYFLKKILFIYLCIYVFIYLFRLGEEGRKRGRETLMWERDIAWLSLVHALTGV